MGHEIENWQPDAGEHPAVLTFDEFCARTGVPGILEDHGALRYPHGISKAEQRRIVSRLEIRMRAIEEARAEARDRYDHLVEAGLVRPPTRIEHLQAVAAGHPGNPAVQASRRILARMASCHIEGEQEL